VEQSWGFGRSWTWRGISGAQARSRIDERSLLGTWCLRWAGGTFSSTQTRVLGGGGVDSVAVGLEGLSVLGILTPIWEFLVGESDSISCEVLHKE
jgi:hypothetical protein